MIVDLQKKYQYSLLSSEFQKINKVQFVQKLIALHKIIVNTAILRLILEVVRAKDQSSQYLIKKIKNKINPTLRKKFVSLLKYQIHN